MPKKKSYRADIQEKHCLPETIIKATNIIASAFIVVPLSVCMSQGDNSFSTVELLDARFASTHTSSLFAVLSPLYGKHHNGKENMAKYINEFQQLFAQLGRIGSNAIFEEFKVSLLLSSMRHNSVLESTIAALRTRVIKALAWTDVTPDLIAE